MGPAVGVTPGGSGGVAVTPGGISGVGSWSGWVSIATRAREDASETPELSSETAGPIQPVATSPASGCGGVGRTDVGTPGLDLVPHIGGARIVVLVDTVKSAGEPGELRLYRKAEILKHPPGPRTNPHDPGVKETLLYLDLAGQGPEEVLLVGIVPGRVEKGLGLTPAVAAAVPLAAEAVAAELRRLGIAVEKRAGSSPARPWWAGEDAASS